MTPASAPSRIQRSFQPGFWASVFALPLFIAMIALGTWQLQRLHWKEEQIALRKERAASPAVDFILAYPADLEDVEAAEFRPFVLRGRFLNDKELYLGARSLDRRIGFQVVTPFELVDGRIVLVNRGWVPSEKRDPQSRAAAQVEGMTSIEALLRIDGWKGYEFVRPSNNAAENFWFYVDTQAMGAAVGLPKLVETAYFDVRAMELEGGYPLGGQTRITLVNNHLQYVITWYAMAVILAVIYFLFHYRPVVHDDRSDG